MGVVDDLKNFKLKNRIGVAPMTRMSSSDDSIPRQDVLDFLVRRAKNGAAIVYTEAIVTDFESAQGYPGQSRLTTQRQIDAWASVVNEMHVSTYDYSEKAFGTDQNMAQITREVTQLPIILCGKIYDRSSCEDALKDADIVLSAKSMLLNPDWVEDVKDGKELLV